MLTAYLAVPLAYVLLAWVLPGRWLRPLALIVGASVLGFAVAVAAGVLRNGVSTGWGGVLRVDGLSAVVLLTVSVVVFGSALHALGYFRVERLGLPRERSYASLWAGFSLTMLAVPMFANLGVVWMLVELTTLSSAFLVAFEGRPEALEAAWKYVVVVTVGVSLALLGTILLYYAAVPVLGQVFSLSWPLLLRHGSELSAGPLRLAFLLIVIGYGTKAGLVPMHTWLPDAHSEAPGPISAMLSGCLLNTALYGILRVVPIARPALGHYPDVVLVAFGLLSLLVAAFSLRGQAHMKRLLAYSSVEHMGIVTLGFGLGAPFFAFLQMVNHTVTKALLFFAAGNATQATGPRIDRARGLLRAMPLTGVALLVGGLAITGAPPLNLFPSEFGILRAAWRGAPWVAWLYLVLLGVVFVAFMSRLTALVFGAPEGADAGLPAPPRQARLGVTPSVHGGTEPGTGAHEADAGAVPDAGGASPVASVAVVLFLALLLVLSVFTPHALVRLLELGSRAVGGGG
ncbi:MAG: proton-conducting transporter membrane subunit [Deinococcales bacterium]